jgi:phenylacetate-CoA ligase
VERQSRTEGMGQGALLAEAPDGAAWSAFHRAVETSPGYRDFLAARGYDAAGADCWQDIPFVEKADVFGGDSLDWMAAPGVTGLAEIVSSSGHTGLFSLGAATHNDQAAMADRVDGLLTLLGAGPDSPTLLVNTLSMGVAVPSRLATVATPSVHVEMALGLLVKVAPRFDRVVLVGEPLFLAELARLWRDASSERPSTFIFTGGEWVAESWRTYVAQTLGIHPGMISVSFGAAEVGVHLLFETPDLGAARRALMGDPAAAAAGTWGDLCHGAYVPSLLTYDPQRLVVEQRAHADGPPTLVVTGLDESALQLVRYDLGDAACVLDADQISQLAVNAGTPIEGPVVALAGRREALSTPSGPLCIEAVKEALFADADRAEQVTGRFRLSRGTSGTIWCDVEARTTASFDSSGLAARISEKTGVSVEVIIHAAGTYPHHAAGDWSHKPRYLNTASVVGVSA